MSEDIRKFIVDDEEGTRLDMFLTTACADLSRSRIQALIKSGEILVNDKQAKPGYKVCCDDEIVCLIPAAVEMSVKPEEMDLNIVYEDKDIIVINKPRGLVVHPAPGSNDSTLVNGLLYHCTDLSGINGVLRPGIVHRLDKDTSGLLVCAKNDNAHNYLANQLLDKTMNRKYIALVHGIIQEPAGLIDAPIGRDPKDRQKMAVVAGQRKAVTEYKVLDRLDGFTVVECSLQTGRTHQIRVHMAYLGYPVVGDQKYGRRKEKLPINTQALHAWHLTLNHPSDGKPRDFYATLPDYFEEILKDLGATNTLELMRQANGTK